MLVRSFPQSIALIGYAPLSILQTADGIAIGLQVATAEGARAVVARPGGEPTHVYRNNRGECFASHLILTPAGHWFGEQLVETNRTESVYVFQPDGAPPAQAEVAPIDWLAAEHSGNELAFAARTDGPGRLAIFDRATGMVSTLKSSVGAARPTFDGNAAFFLGVEEYNHPLGWVWRSSDAAFEQLLDSGDEVVADLRSDGETLVWLQVPPPGEQGEWYAGTLYRSPRATHPDEVMATPVRPMVATGPVPPATIGAGRYAVYSPYTNALYVIRLDDGRLWTVPLPSAEIPGDVTDVSFIDDEVLYFKTETEIYRQRLDALGEGEAAPDP